MLDKIIKVFKKECKHNQKDLEYGSLTVRSIGEVKDIRLDVKCTKCGYEFTDGGQFIF